MSENHYKKNKPTVVYWSLRDFASIDNNPISEFDAFVLQTCPPAPHRDTVTRTKGNGLMASCDPPGPKSTVALGVFKAMALNAAQVWLPCLNSPAVALNNPENPVVPILRWDGALQ